MTKKPLQASGGMCIIVVESGRKWVIMFFGQYEHSLDDKGRLVIPRKFREEAGAKLFIMKGHDGALSVYRQEDFLKELERIQKLPFNKQDPRSYTRVSMSSVVEIDVDKTGRMLLPTQVIDRYSVGKDVVVVGVLDHFEIWNKDAWYEYLKDSEAKYEDMSENLPQE